MSHIRTIMAAALAVVLLAGSSFAADTYTFDIAHSSIGFSVRHMGLSKVRGNFTDFSGSITHDPEDITNSSVNVTIKTASINTDNERRDNHLRSADFFAADSIPEITFVSDKVVQQGDGYVAHGTLTMRGVAKKIELPFTLTGPITVRPGEQRIAVQSGITLNRQDYGVSWSKILDTGGLVVSDDVDVSLEIEAVME
jgi:polyisoprenoid-binding protein YceI